MDREETKQAANTLRAHVEVINQLVLELKQKNSRVSVKFDIEEIHKAIGRTEKLSVRITEDV